MDGHGTRNTGVITRPGERSPGSSVCNLPSHSDFRLFSSPVVTTIPGDHLLFAKNHPCYRACAQPLAPPESWCNSSGAETHPVSYTRIRVVLAESQRFRKQDLDLKGCCEPEAVPSAENRTACLSTPARLGIGISSGKIAKRLKRFTT